MTRLRIALQKSGRLSDRSRDLLRDAGFRIGHARSDLTARVENFPADLMFVRDDDIPTFVADGVCELGVVGQNVLAEHEAADEADPVDVLAELGFGRCTLKLAAPRDAAYEGPHSLAGARVATSYPRLTARWLRERGVEAEVVRMSGAVELAPRLGLAPYICDLVSTGATLDANNLRAVDTVLESQAVLIRTRSALSPDALECADQLLRRVHGVLATQESKYIMMNAPESALPEITRILPGVEAPTVLPLAGAPGHVAVHAVARESVFWETLHELKAAGASAILVVPIEKMLP